jgi:hypothetical protein
MPVFEERELERRDKIISFFEENEEKAFQLEEIYSKIGRTIKISFFDYIFRLKDLGRGRVLIHMILPLLLLGIIISVFFYPQYMLFPAIIMIAINVIMYFKFKEKIRAYYVCFGYLTKIIVQGENIYKANIPEIEEYKKL